MERFTTYFCFEMTEILLLFRIRQCIQTLFRKVPGVSWLFSHRSVCLSALYQSLLWNLNVSFLLLTAAAIRSICLVTLNKAVYISVCSEKLPDISRAVAFLSLGKYTFHKCLCFEKCSSIKYFVHSVHTHQENWYFCAFGTFSPRKYSRHFFSNLVHGLQIS